MRPPDSQGAVRARVGPRLLGAAAILALDACLGFASAGLSPAVRDGWGGTPQERPTPGPAEPCAENHDVPAAATEGLVRVRLVAPCRRGQTLVVQTSDAAFEAIFDDAGVIDTLVPIFRNPDVLRWPGADGRAQERQVLFPNARRMLRVALIWSGEAVLSLRVNESLTWLPGGSCKQMWRGGTCRGLGRIDASPPGPGTHYEIYTLSGIEAPRKAKLRFGVYFDSRVPGGDPAFCGDGRWAEPTFKVVVLSNGTADTNRRSGGFSRQPCSSIGAELSSAPGEVELAP